MKISYILNGRLPTEKANGYQVSQMCQAFIENGAKVDLLKPSRSLLPEHEPYRFKIDEFYNLRISPAVKEIHCVDWLSFFHQKMPALDKFQFIWNLLNLGGFSLGLIKHLRSERFESDDLIYLRDVNVLSFIYPFLPKRIRSRIVLELHHLPEKKSRKIRYAKILSKCMRVVTITGAMKETLLSLGMDAEKILIEHDGVDLGTFQIDLDRDQCRDYCNLSKSDFIIGYVGNFHTNGREKGIDDLIAASKELLAERADIKFLFVGGPLDRVDFYKSIIRKNNLPEDKFEFRGRVPITQVPIVMRSCDLLTIPLPWNEHFAFYMSPMKLFEYMSTGVPIFSTNVPGVAEILKHEQNAYMVKHSNRDDMSRGLVEVVKDQALRERIGKSAIAEIDHYSWKNRAKRILDFLSPSA